MVLLGLASLLWAQGEPLRRLEQECPPHGTLRWDRGSQPVLLVEPLPGDGWLTMARRLCGTTSAARRLWDANPGLQAPLRDRPVRVPVEMLDGELRRELIQRLFPADQRVSEGWQHQVLDPFAGGEESWLWLAELFTGTAEQAGTLRRANPDQPDQAPRRRSTVMIPEHLLLPALRSLPAVTPTPTAIPTVTVATPTVTVGTPTPATPAADIEATPPPAADGVLSFGRDSEGEHAVYRLRAGEALYSAVVVRFTGQVSAEQVNETAAQLARRSGIRDVTDIPIGYPIKIPLDLLLPMYLPADHPRRQQWLAEQAELARYVEVVQATDLDGVHVVLDPGHGGLDTGALVGGVWESTYTYDLVCRIKDLLERHTRATVWMTSQDKSRHYLIPEQNRLQQDRDQELLTHPPFDLSSYTAEQRHLAIHLRWYLTNDIINRLEKQGVPRSKVVFISVHANSLHRSVKGAMVYVPSRHLRPDSYTVKDRALNRYQEYRNRSTYRYSHGFRNRSEASSRRLAQHILESMADSGIAVHPYQPIRDRIAQGKRSYVPAVLRFTGAQHAVLLEVCNMANQEDRDNLQQRTWREQLARSVVSGLAATFR